MMCKTSGDAARKMTTNYQDWIIDTLDKQGRMSLKPITIAERPSEIHKEFNSDYSLRTTKMANSANPKSIPRISQINSLKFVRKSDLKQDFLDSKSVISIKGDKEYEFRFAKNNSLTGNNYCNTMPPNRENEKVFEFESSF